MNENRSWVDDDGNSYNPDDANMGFLVLVGLVIYTTSMRSDDAQVAFWAQLSFVCAIGNVLFTAWYPAWRHPEKTSFWSEMSFALRDPVDMLGPVFLFWPVWLLFALGGYSYRFCYLQNYWHRVKRERQGIHNETVCEWRDDEETLLDARGQRMNEAVANVGELVTEMPAVACRAAVLTTALAGVAAPVAAQHPAKPSLVATLQFDSAKLIKNGVVPYNQPIIQGDITAAWSNGVYMNLLGEDNFRGHTKPGRQEIDGTIGWRSRNLQLGVTYRDRTPPLKDGNGNVVNPFIEVDAPWQVSEKHSLTPYARFEWVQALRHSGVNTGNLLDRRVEAPLAGFGRRIGRPGTLGAVRQQRLQEQSGLHGPLQARDSRPDRARVHVRSIAL